MSMPQKYWHSSYILFVNAYESGAYKEEVTADDAKEFEVTVEEESPERVIEDEHVQELKRLRHYEEGYRKEQQDIDKIIEEK
jgi:hypothetical protein